MKSWRMRVARALAVAAASTSVVAGVAGPARADGFTALPINKVGELAVDGVHQRVLISDPTTSKIVQTDYAGAVTATKDGYPGVDDLLLSADGQRLFAAWPDGHAIVALDPADLSEIARYPVGDGISPHHLAAAGDRVWFGYRATADTGGIGSLDLRGAAPVVTLDDGAQRWQDAPRLAATAGRPGLLAAAGLAPAEGERKANFAVFDVSGDTPARTARLDFWAVPAEIALTPDGATLLYPWNDTLVSRGTTDLATNTGPLVMTHTAHAVDVAADGTVAGGSWSPYDPDVHLFTSAGTLIRRYELPDTGKASYTSDTLDYGALAWEPGGDQLFGVAFNDVGEYSLSRLSTPRKSVPEFTLTGPTSARRAAALTLTGKLTASLALPTGTPVSVTRLDPETPGGRALGAVTTTAGGAFTVRDTPPAGGKVTYRVTYAGDATHENAAVAWSLSVARSTPTLTLNRRTGTVFAYGTKASFTVHLGGAYTNRTVEIWADPYGADQPNRLIRRAAVNSRGDVAATIPLTRNTKVTAVYAGDTRTAARSVNVTVYTGVTVSQAASRYYRTGKLRGTKYRYYHARTDPKFVTTMTYQKNRSQYVDVQYYANGKWHSWGWAWVRLAANGKSTVTIVGSHERNLRMRVRAGYVYGQHNSGDILNHTTYSAWTYFIFTN